MNSDGPFEPVAFDEFVRTSDLVPKRLAALTDQISSILPELPWRRAEEFTQRLHAVAFSEKFLKEVADEVGVPLEDEDEETFVQRGLDTVRRRLDRRLGTKR